ncbi:MAG: ATP-binding protein [Vulcanisaeta sp.]
MIDEYNPWWLSRDRIDEFEPYRRYQESEVRWVPDVIDRVSLRPFSLNFIIGPRQVGKTTAVALLIERLLESGVDPRSVFYFSCDRLADYRELDEVLRDYLRIRGGIGISTSYIFLDEVTYPREWYRAIKGLIDSGVFRNDVLVLTGSLSMSAKREIEAFPGRRGYGKNILMLPLPFSQYVRLFNINIPSGDLDFVLSNFQGYIQYLPILNELLDKYLVTGGFPNSIRDFFRSGRVAQSTIDDFIASISSDLNKLRRSETFFKLAVRGIIERTSSEFSYHTLARSFGVGTVKTAISYVELLSNLFLLRVVDAVDQLGNVLPRKEKKFFFIDPFIYEAFSRWTMTKKPDEHGLTEAVVVSHLSRLFDVFYLKVNSEVDVVIRRDGELIGFEVKYGDVKGVKRILGRMKRVYVLTKDKFGSEMVPVSLFLAMLNTPQSIELRIMV